MNTEKSRSTDYDKKTFRIAVLAEPDEPAQLSDVLVQTLGLNDIDAHQHARWAPGLLPDVLDQDTATQLAEAVTQIGLKAIALTEAEIPLQAEPHVVHHLSCSPEALMLYDLRGERSAVIDWTKISLISVGYIPLESAHHESVESTVVLRSTHRTLYGHQDTQAKAGPAVWILTQAEPSAMYINHNEMNYEYLQERKSGSATANFQLLMQDLRDFATLAYLTPATRAYLDQGLLMDYEFESANALKHATQYHAILQQQLQADA